MIHHCNHTTRSWHMTKTFNPIDVTSSLGFAEYLPDDDMIAANKYRHANHRYNTSFQASYGRSSMVPVPVPFSSACDREGRHYSISLKDTKNHILTSNPNRAFLFLSHPTWSRSSSLDLKAQGVFEAEYHR